MLKKGLIGSITAFLLILIDQITKAAAVKHLKGNVPFVIWEDVFELRYLENRGAAFGIMQNQQIFFIIMTFLVVLGIIYLYFWRIPNNLYFFPINAIAILFFSGAVGNLIDRIANHYVIDFFYFKLIDFPIFNVADIYVTGGAFSLLLLSFFYYKDEDFDIIISGKKL